MAVLVEEYEIFLSNGPDVDGATSSLKCPIDLTIIDVMVTVEVL